MKKTYIKGYASREPRPRSERLRALGGYGNILQETSGAGQKDWYSRQAVDNKLSLKLDKSVFDDLFAKESDGNGGYRIKARYALYSVGGVSAFGDSTTPGSGGGATSLAELDDITLTDPVSGQALVYDGEKWTNQTLSPGLDEAELSDYLTTHGYATEQWVTGRGYITSAALSGYATQAWVQQQGYLTEHQSLSAYLTKTEAAAAYLRNDGTNGTQAGVSTLIGKLTEGQADCNDDTFFVTSNVNPATNSLYYRRKALYLWSYIKGKADAVYQPKGNYLTGITKAQVEAVLTGDITSHTHPQYLTSHQPIYALTIQRNGTPVGTYTPNSAAKTINITDVASAATLAGHTANGTIHITASERSAWNGKLDKSAFDDLFAKESDGNGGYRIKARYALYSVGGVSAFGDSTTPGGGTGGGNAEILSNNYGKYLRINGEGGTTLGDSSATAIAYAANLVGGLPWSKVTGKPTTLSGYGITDGVSAVSVTGSGNAVTEASVSGHTLTLTKGATFLTTSAAASTYAKLASANNLVHSGNEITMIPGGYSGVLHINFRTTGAVGNLSEYIFDNGNAAGGLANIRAKGFIVHGGTSSQFLKANGSVDGNSYLTTGTASSTYVKKSGDTMTGKLTLNGGLKFNNLTNYTASNAWLLSLYEGEVRYTQPSQLFVGNSDMLDGLHLTDIRSVGYAMQQTYIDATALDQNTYYPVTMYLLPHRWTYIAVTAALSYTGGAKPSWATHDSGFSVRKVWYSNGYAWGTIDVDRVILSSTYEFADTDPVRGIGQLTNGSIEYVYVRGGGYYCFCTSHGVMPYLQTGTYTNKNQSVSPTTTPPAAISRNNAKITDNVASATYATNADMLDGLHNGELNARYINSYGIPAGGTVMQWVTGQRPIGTAVGNVFIGSSAIKDLWSFPEIYADYDRGVANIMNLRFSWSNSYWKDILMTPNTHRIFYRTVVNSSPGYWRELAFLDSNVASATKLQTARTIWGQSFDGTQSVSGSLSGVGVIGFANGSEIGFSNNRYCFGTASQQTAKGVNVGSLLISNAWADFTYVPTAGAYVKGNIATAGVLSSSYNTGTFLHGNQGGALINSTAPAGAYVMLAKLNSTNGYFTHGAYQTRYELHYTAKSTVDAGTNTYTYLTTLMDEAGRMGVGTQGPTEKLDVIGNAIVRYPVNDGVFIKAQNNVGVVGLLINRNKGVYDFTADTWIVASNGTNTWMPLGNVGIGTTTPAYKLDVQGSFRATGGLTVGSGYVELYGATPFIDFHYANSTADYTSRIIEGSSGLLHINDTIFARMSGNVGIGTSSPAYKLDVAGSAIFSDWIRSRGSAGWYSESYGGGWHMTDSTWIRAFNGKSIYTSSGIIRTDGHFELGASGAGLWWDSANAMMHFNKGVYSDGEVSAFGVSTTSDERLKTDWHRVRFTAEQLAKAPCGTFAWTDRRRGRSAGSTAQYWQGLLPELVSSRADGTLSLHYDKAALMGVVSLADCVLSIETRQAAQERELSRLRKQVRAQAAQIAQLQSQLNNTHRYVQ